MPARITLTVVAGEPMGREYVFSSPTVGTVGRGSDCLVRLPNDGDHLNVSRRHCLLDIDPPVVRVRDLGSRNGTFVNAQIIGRRPRAEYPGLVAGLLFPFFPVHDGDEIRVGDTVFRVTTSVWSEDTEHLPDESKIPEPVFG